MPEIPVPWFPKATKEALTPVPGVRVISKPMKRMFVVLPLKVSTAVLFGETSCAVYVPAVLGQFKGGRPACDVTPE